MEANFKLAILLFCVGNLVTQTEALRWLGLTESSICQTNENAARLIRGDTNNAIRNFLSVISSKGTFALVGDTTTQTGGCRRTMDSFKHRKGRYYIDRVWIIDCWDPTECKLVEEGILFKLIPSSTPSSASVQTRTVFLPLDEHETASYTFLPFVADQSMMFATAMLSGCSVFVLKPNNRNCNLVMIHTNYRCGDKTITAADTDVNHRQAMAVLEEVESLNSPTLRCSYVIERRWAVDYWRPAIDAARHDYAQNIYYYNINDGLSFLYGSHLDGSSGGWMFCTKIARPNPPHETCFSVDFQGEHRWYNIYTMFQIGS